MSLVKPEYGPPLPELLAGLPVRARWALIGLIALVVAGGAWLALTARDEETVVSVREPVAFNLAYGPEMHRVQQRGALLALERTRGSLFLDSYVVKPLTLRPYRGQAGGTLPVVAFDYIRALRKRFQGFSLVGEGRTRVNNFIGYQVVFRARRGARTLYGRHLMLVPELPEGQLRGLLVELTSTPAAGTPNADGTGTVGALKRPTRSLRSGTDREGGEQ